MPEKVNLEIGKADLEKGFGLIGEVKAEEDKGWRVGLGLNKDEGMGAMEGWVNKDDVEKFLPGKLNVSAMLCQMKADEE